MASEELQERFEKTVLPLKHIPSYPVFLAKVLWDQDGLATPVSGD